MRRRSLRLSCSDRQQRTLGGLGKGTGRGSDVSSTHQVSNAGRLGGRQPPAACCLAILKRSPALSTRGTSDTPRVCARRATPSAKRTRCTAAKRLPGPAHRWDQQAGQSNRARSRSKCQALRSMPDVRRPTRSTILGRHGKHFRNWVACPLFRCSLDLGGAEPESEVVLGGWDTAPAW